MGSRSVAIPAGFEVETPRAAAPALPPGFEIEPAAPPAALLPHPNAVAAATTAAAQATIAPVDGPVLLPGRELGFGERLRNMVLAPDSALGKIFGPKGSIPDWEALTRNHTPGTAAPMLKLSELNGADTEAKTISEGARRGFMEGLEGWTSPEGLAIMVSLGRAGKLGAAGRALAGAIGAGFDAKMIEEGIRGIPEAKAAWDAGKQPEAARIAMRNLLTATIGVYGARSKGRELAGRTIPVPEQDAPPPRPAGRRPEGEPGPAGPKLNRDQRRATAMPPETGTPEQIERAQAEREAIIGKPRDQWTNSDVIAADELRRQGYTGASATIGENDVPQKAVGAAQEQLGQVPQGGQPDAGPRSFGSGPEIRPGDAGEQPTGPPAGRPTGEEGAPAEGRVPVETQPAAAATPPPEKEVIPQPPTEAQPGAGGVEAAKERARARWRKHLDASADAAEQRIGDFWKEAGSTLHAGVPVHILADYAISGARKIVNGTERFTDWSAEMVRDHGPQIQQHLRKIWDEAKHIAGKYGWGEEGSEMPIGQRLTVQAAQVPPESPQVTQAPRPHLVSKAFSAMDKWKAENAGMFSSREGYVKGMSELFRPKNGRVPLPPDNLIRYGSDDAAVSASIDEVLPSQRQMAEAGLRESLETRKLYEAGKMTPAETALYFIWGGLSPGQSPYPHEAAFLRALASGIDQFVEAAHKGQFGPDELTRYLQWAPEVLKGSPGAQATANLNAVGKQFLTNASKTVENGPYKGMRVMDAIHEIVKDFSLSSTEARRRYQEIVAQGGLGADNKVFSFVLLVTGHHDTLVVDRVRINDFWDAPGLEKAGLTRYSDAKGNQQTTSNLYDNGFNAYWDGVTGLGMYEAAESAIAERVKRAYAARGIQDGTLGRWHWETWVSKSGQEVSHGSLGAIPKIARHGMAPADAAVGEGIRQGKFNSLEYGSRYVKTPDGYHFIWEKPNGQKAVLTPESHRRLLDTLTQQRDRATIPAGQERAIQYGTKTSEASREPWRNLSGVNKAALDSLIDQHSLGALIDRHAVAPPVLAGEVPGRVGSVPDGRVAAAVPEGLDTGQGSILGAMDRAVDEAKSRLKSRARELLRSERGEQTNELDPQDLEDLVTVGSHYLKEGARSFERFSSAMVEEFGDDIRPYLKQVYARAAGGQQQPPPVTATEPPAPAPDSRRLTTSPNYEESKGRIPDNVNVPDEVRDELAQRMAAWEQDNPERRAVTFNDIRAEAAALDPALVLQLKRPQAGQTLDPALRFAARDMVNGLNLRIVQARKALAARMETADPTTIMAEEQRIGELEKTVQGLLDVLIPTRSQDGRNLAYHRMMAESTFDVEYWIARAKRAAGGALAPAKEGRIREILAEGQAAEAEAKSETAAQSVNEQKAKQEVSRQQKAVKQAQAKYDEMKARVADIQQKGAAAAERVKELRKGIAQAAKDLRDAKRAYRKAEVEYQRTLRTYEQRIGAVPPVKAATERLKVARQQLAQEMAKVERTGVLDTIVALRRAGLLTGVKTHLRNLGGNLAFQVLEEVARIPAAVVDVAMSSLTGRRTVSGADARAMAQATRAAATRGVREAREIMKQGATAEDLAKMDLPRELNSGNRFFDAYANTVFRSLSAEDKLFRVYAYERSLREQMKIAGADVPTEAMRAQAVADAEFATFNNKNVLAQGLRSMQGRMKPMGDAGRAASFALDLVVPFANTPANILARVIDYAGPGAAVKTVRAALKATTDRAMTPELQRTISLNLGRGATGAALITLGYMLARNGKMTGVRSDDRGLRDRDEAIGRPPGAVLAGGRWYQVVPFSPTGNLLSIGATLYQERNRPLKDEAKRPGNVAKIATRTVLEQPMLKGAQDVVEGLMQPGARAEAAVGSMAGSFVPTLVSDAAGLGDTTRRDTSAESTLQSAANNVAGRLPGLRNTLPPRVNALGEVEDQPRTGAVDPTLSRRSREADDPALARVAVSGVGISKITKRTGEGAEEFRLRQVVTGKEIARHLRGVVEDPDYLTTDAESRKLMVEKAIHEARLKISRVTSSKAFKESTERERIQALRDLME